MRVSLLKQDQIIANRGYPVENHTIQTPDGYLLTSQRIPYGKKSPAAQNKPVVFLQHGLLCASSDWILGPVDKALGTEFSNSFKLISFKNIIFDLLDFFSRKI